MQQNINRAFPVLVMVFFFWGFVAASNDILIPVFKEKLHLEQFQAQMISFAFYVAYTVGSLIYFLISRFSKGDVLNRLGYKNGIILGLCISASGTLLFIPAAELQSFGLMISGLFIVGLGFSLQQTAANPLAIVLGNPATGSQRLSLAGGVNNVGTTIGPILISLAIFGSLHAASSLPGIEAVKTPYLILGGAFLLVALFIKLSPIPNTLETKQAIHAEDMPAENDKGSAIKYPQLWMGMIAIFLYVGVEVSTAGNLPEFMKQHLGKSADQVSPFVSLFWASLMIGRWTASIGAFKLSKDIRSVLSFVIPYAAFAFYLIVNFIANHDIQPFLIYGAVIPFLILADILSKGDPSRQLFIFSIFGIVALCIGMFADGMVSVFAFISVGLFCSTLWPCIFSLAINKLGKYTNEGSGLLIMMIMGGGFVSLFQGWLAGENMLGIQWSYWVGVACFAYLAFYAMKMRKTWMQVHELPSHPDMLDA